MNILCFLLHVLFILLTFQWTVPFLLNFKYYAMFPRLAIVIGEAQIRSWMVLRGLFQTHLLINAYAHPPK